MVVLAEGDPGVPVIVCANAGIAKAARATPAIAGNKGFLSM
jgi:hypothetical protein